MDRISLSEYEITGELYAHRDFRLYLAVGKEDGQKVSLKTSVSDYPEIGEINRLKNEFRVGQKHSGSLPRVYKKFEDGRRLFLVSDWLQGIPLTVWREGRSLEDYLDLALSLSGIFADMEANRIVHGDVRPDYFIVDRHTLRVHLVEWSRAFFLDEIRDPESRPPAEREALPYISPELTGRTTWQVDHRSDLYSLGVCLYWLFTGHLPFRSEDPQELVYYHMARQPVPPHKLNPEIPGPLSSLLIKLLEKSPSERYSSANALHHDLKYILGHLDEAEQLRTYKIGRSDLSGQLRPPETVIGRDAEIEILRGQFARARAGASRLALLTGPQGIGKSFLAANFQDELQHEETLLVTGAFAEVHRDIGSSALIDGIRRLLRRFLSLESQALNEWRGRLQEIGDVALSTLMHLLPELQHFTEGWEQAPELEAEEDQKRTYFAFRSLIRVLAGPEHPLVISLDDVQWADFTTLKLIQELAADPDLEYFLFLGVVREGDIENPPFVQETLGSIAEAENCLRLQLEGLQQEDLAKWLSETLGPTRDHTGLASLLSRRTRGIPFFVNQFLWFTQAKGLLRFISTEGAWSYDLQAVQNLPVSDSIAELVQSRAVLLSPQLKQILSVASILGYRFSSRLLASFLKMDAREVAKALQQAGDFGIILSEPRPEQARASAPLGFHEDHRFLHNSLQGFFYRELPGEEAEDLHLRIGVYLEQIKAGEDAEFQVLRHLNQGIALIGDHQRLVDLARRNLACGLKAQKNNAYEQAIFYLGSGLEFLKKSGVKHEVHEAGYDLLYHFGECQYLIGEYPAAEKAFSQLLAGWKSITLQIKSVKALCRLLIIQGRHEECLAEGKRVLGDLHVEKKLPESKGAIRFALIRGLIGMRFSLTARKLSRVHELPPCEDPEVLAVLSLYRELLVSSLSVNPSLFGLIVLRQVQLTLKHGLSGYAASAFMSYAVMNAVALKDYTSARKLGQLAIALSLETGMSVRIWETRFAWQHFLLHLRESVRENLDGFVEISKKLLAHGDPVFSGYMLNSRLWSKACLGVSLDEVRQEAARYTRNFRIKGDEELLDMMMPRLAFCEVLQSQQERPWLLETEDYHFEEKFEQLRARGSYSVLGGMVLAKVQLCWLFRRAREGVEMIERGEAFISNMEGIFFTSDYYLYASLVYSSYYQEIGKKPPRSVMKKIRSWLKLLKKLSAAAPANYASHHALVRAEFEILKGNPKRAEDQYQVAAELARKYTHPLNYALANELRFRLLERRGRAEAGREYLLNARQAYRLWGGVAKVRFLEDLYSIHFQGKEDNLSGDSAGNPAFFAKRGERLDLNSILKAANALAGETRINRLLETLVRILLENAVSQRGCFILNDGGQFRIKVVGELKESHFQASHPESALSPEYLPVSVVNYVRRTRETVILNEGILDKYPSDSYLQTHQPRSILCQPVLKSGKVLGIIYLENRLVPNSFTPLRVELLSLLSGQIGISIENAILIENLEQKVQERTQELELEKQKSEDLLLNILPEQTATELKETGKTRARKYDSVSILFSDVLTFTQHAEEASPGQLVEYLDTYFHECDQIVEKYGLEKIKTIGDAYLCVGGLPQEDPDCHVNTVRAAREMLQAVERLHAEGRIPFQIRVGIHSGAVVAGVVGSKKFAFDIWGDDVNIAARMESSSEAGKINISESTYQRVKDHFTCTYRGKIKAKNKGALPMYFVEA